MADKGSICSAHRERVEGCEACKYTTEVVMGADGENVIRVVPIEED